MYNEEGTILSDSNAYYRKIVLKLFDAGTNWIDGKTEQKSHFVTKRNG